MIYLQHPTESHCFDIVLVLNKRHCIMLSDLSVRTYSWINQHKKQFRLNKGQWFDGPRVFRAKRQYFVFNVMKVIL